MHTCMRTLQCMLMSQRKSQGYRMPATCRCVVNHLTWSVGASSVIGMEALLNTAVKFTTPVEAVSMSLFRVEKLPGREAIRLYRLVTLPAVPLAVLERRAGDGNRGGARGIVRLGEAGVAEGLGLARGARGGGLSLGWSSFVSICKEHTYDTWRHTCEHPMTC